MSERFEEFGTNGFMVIKDNEQEPHLLNQYQCCVRLNEFVDKVAELETKLEEKEKKIETICIVKNSRCVGKRQVTELKIKEIQNQKAIAELEKVRNFADGRTYLAQYIKQRIKELKGEQ